MPHTILMGDPRYFSIKGGANPHTRNRWGRRKMVDKAKAIDQWQTLKQTLEAHGIEVWVVPPDENWPGTVYPANAGFMFPSNGHPSAGWDPDPFDAELNVSPSTKGDPNLRWDDGQGWNNDPSFFLSNLIPSRSGEQASYQKILESKGIECRNVSFRFEGEADFFPAYQEYIFTCGPIEQQRFVPRWGLPPWKRVYGFRSDEKGLADLQAIVSTPIRKIRLIKETHYHGDTVLCAFGNDSANRRGAAMLRPYLLAYMEGLDPSAARQLQTDYGKRLIPLSESDAFSYAANSFQFIKDGQVHLVMHSQVSSDLQNKIKAFGVELILVDVSEFLKKGGGSVKCMIGDLGHL